MQDSTAVPVSPEEVGHEDDRANTPVTTVIRQRPKQGAVARYEEWLKEIIPVATQFCGHRGVNVIRPHGKSDAYTVVLHFDRIENLRRWLDSDIRARLIEKIRPYLRADEDIDITTGIEFWFTRPPGGKPAKPYKQYLITLSAIFPLTLIVPWLFSPLFAHVPFLATIGVRQILIDAVIVAGMVYVIMPRYTRAVSKWLYD